MWGGRNPTSWIIVRNLPWQIYNNQINSATAWKSLIGFNQYERWMDQNRKMCVKIYFMNKHMHDQCLIYLKRVYFQHFQILEVIPREDYVFVPKFGITKSISLTNKEFNIQGKAKHLEEKNQILQQELNFDAGQDKGSVQIKTETKETKIDHAEDKILPENEKGASVPFDLSSASDLPDPVAVDAHRTVEEKVAADLEEKVKTPRLESFSGFSSDEECLEDLSMFSSSIQIVTVPESSVIPDEKLEPLSVSVGDSYDLGAAKLTLDNSKLVQEFSNFCSNNSVKSRSASSLLKNLEMSNITLVYCFHIFRTTNRKLFPQTILQNLDNKCRTNFSLRLLTQFCKHVNLNTSKYNSNSQNAILHEKQNYVLKNKRLKKCDKLPNSVLPNCAFSTSKEKHKPPYFHIPSNPHSKNVDLAEFKVLQEELPIHQDVLGDTSNHQDVLGDISNRQGVLWDISNHQDVLKDTSNHQDVLGNNSNHQDVLGNNSNHQDVYGNTSNNQDVLRDFFNSDVVEDHSNHKYDIEDHSINQDVTEDHFKHQDVTADHSKLQGVVEDISNHKDVFKNYSNHQDVTAYHSKHQDVTADHSKLQGAVEDLSNHKDVFEDYSNHKDVIEDHSNQQDVIKILSNHQHIFEDHSNNQDVFKVHVKHQDVLKDYLISDLPSLDRTSQCAINSSTLLRKSEISGFPRRDYVVPYSPSECFQDLQISNVENNKQYPTKGSLNEEENNIQDISNRFDVNDLKLSETHEILRLKSEKGELSNENNKLRQKIIFQSDVIKKQEIAVVALLCCVPLAVWGLHIWGPFLVLVFFLIK